MCANLRQEVCTLVGPAHLLLLRHPHADHLVDGRLGNAAADRATMTAAAGTTPDRAGKTLK